MKKNNTYTQSECTLKLKLEKKNQTNLYKDFCYIASIHCVFWNEGGKVVSIPMNFLTAYILLKLDQSAWFVEIQISYVVQVKTGC